MPVRSSSTTTMTPVAPGALRGRVHGSAVRRRFRAPRPLAAAGVISLLLAGLIGVVALPVGAAAAATIGNVPAAVADDGAKVTGETVIDARTIDLTISSPAIGKTTARLLLPEHWTSSPALYWPTLYLLPGANDAQDYRSWTAYTDVEAFMADKDVLTVLPSGGPAGVYTDQYNPLKLPGVPKWETYHTVELPQILQRGYRSNGVKAVAGLSIGGYGALIYAARHPGMYTAAASYSGLTNIFNLSALVAVTGSRLANGQFYPPWGSAVLNHANWVAHNPLDQAPKLKGTALFVSSGDGSTGPLDDPKFKDLESSRVIEGFTGSMNQVFVARLKHLGIPVTTDLYGGGYHYWNYWQREFHRSWTVLAAGLGAPTTAPVPAAAVAATSTSRWHAIFG